MKKRRALWLLLPLWVGVFCLFGCKAKDVACVESFSLTDGPTADNTIASRCGASDGTSHWVVWLPSETFGKVIDFSTEESYVLVENSRFDYTKNFTLSVWVKAPQRDTKGRTLLSFGSKNEFRLYLNEKNNNELTLAIKGFKIEPSGASIDDGLWHHITVCKSENEIQYYIDGKLVHSAAYSYTLKVTGTQTLVIGADTNRIHSFDGSMAELKIAQGVYTPSEMTSVTLNPSDNEPKDPVWNYKHGVVIDRPQYTSTLVPQSYTELQDLINCRDMGFDHVKLQLTPEWMIDDDGHLIEENLAYIDSVVDMCTTLNYPCILCVSPCASGIDYNFKSFYLGDLDMFEKLCNWYAELGRHIERKGWSETLLALQLMTEPHDNNPSYSWTWESDRMYGAVRNVLPYHTIITSANQAGNIEALKKMSPATDDNLIYSFTTYEPYAVGWSSAYSSQVGSETFWNYVGEVPYPIEEGVDYTDAILEAIKNVPDKYYNQAKSALTSYVKGKFDGGSPTWTNQYDSLYNRAWHFERAKSLDDWSQANGGNIHIMVVEFGAYDSLYSTERFGSVGAGISDQKRLELIRDLRESFEAYDIGWCYWSYNEGFTVFKPSYHVNHVGDSPSAEEAVLYADYDLLINALGLTPSIKTPAENTLWATDLDKKSLDLQGATALTFLGTLSQTTDGRIFKLDPADLIIEDFTSYHNIWGSATSWDGECIYTSTDFRGTLIFCFVSPWRDYAYYLENDGTLNLRLYVDDATHIRNGQIELSTSPTPNDSAEYAWEIRPLNLHDGWNDIKLHISTCAFKNGDLSDIKTIRIYLNPSGPITLGLDEIWLHSDKASGAGVELKIEDGELIATSTQFGTIHSGLYVSESTARSAVALSVSGKTITFTLGENATTKVLPAAFIVPESADLTLTEHVQNILLTK